MCARRGTGARARTTRACWKTACCDARARRATRRCTVTMRWRRARWTSSAEGRFGRVRGMKCDTCADIKRLGRREPRLDPTVEISELEIVNTSLMILVTGEVCGKSNATRRIAFNAKLCLRLGVIRRARRFIRARHREHTLLRVHRRHEEHIRRENPSERLPHERNQHIHQRNRHE